jgi:hypothetical protein
MADKDASKSGKPKDMVIVVVNGVETTVGIQGNPSLSDVVETALEQTNNSGQPLDNWELRGPDSIPIPDLSIKIKKLDLAPEDRLFLNLRAGIGG